MILASNSFASPDSGAPFESNVLQRQGWEDQKNCPIELIYLAVFLDAFMKTLKNVEAATVG